MQNTPESEYFDLHTTGLGYLNRVREVKPTQGKPYLAVTLAALRGSTDNVQYTYFDCRVTGQVAQDLVRELAEAANEKRRVLVGFRLGDLYAETFTFRRGARTGETGISLKARLLKIHWIKVDGKTVPIPQESCEQAA